VRATARPITERTGVGTRSLGSANTSRSIHHGTRVGTAANGNGNNGELQREHKAEPNDDDEVKRLASRQAYNGLGLRMAVLGLLVTVALNVPAVASAHSQGEGMEAGICLAAMSHEHATGYISGSTQSTNQYCTGLKASIRWKTGSTFYTKSDTWTSDLGGWQIAVVTQNDPYNCFDLSTHQGRPYGSSLWYFDWIDHATC
jgi:hypothetical protein